MPLQEKVFKEMQKEVSPFLHMFYITLLYNYLFQP
jgi:hypothetical protein